ncbi:oxygen-insensitive NAD(P)H nitroreductase [Pokkaliibacter sp. CJK22405]|uniref:oxygen-insensitive NAD(P)H nitroreductase n=1 Tax=Pokkaliibacter sp. CJK22405 TaxID=3384615 RepID=UPI0039852A1E
MSFAANAKRRYTTKAFDASRKISAEVIDELKTLLHLSPSSVNSQPWHFVLSGSEEGKALIAKGCPAPAYGYNTEKILNASHVVVFCARTSMDEEHLQAVLAQEKADGRLPDEAAVARQHGARSHYVNLHRYTMKDTQHWMEKQVYLAAGSLLTAAANLDLDATPIEGFEPALLDEALGLRDKGLTSVVIVALGYRDDADFNAALPKSRLPVEQIISEI